ncbi:hypothetical protein RFF84_10610, partial [Streptococcus ruminantium]
PRILFLMLQKRRSSKEVFAYKTQIKATICSDETDNGFPVVKKRRLELTNRLTQQIILKYTPIHHSSSVVETSHFLHDEKTYF